MPANLVPAHTKKLLFVDDRSKRIHAALRKYAGEYDVTIAPNVPEALRLLSSEEWDVVSLDADLDGNDFCDPYSKQSGMEILRNISVVPWSKKMPEWIIHSSNVFVADMMELYLLEWLRNDNRFSRWMVRRERFTYDEENQNNLKPVLSVSRYVISEYEWHDVTSGKLLKRRCLSCAQYKPLGRDGLCEDCFNREKSL